MTHCVSGTTVTYCVSSTTMTYCVSGTTVTYCVSGTTLTYCVSGTTMTYCVSGTMMTYCVSGTMMTYCVSGTTMMLEEAEEGAAPLDLHLPSWVSLQRHNRANRQFNPVDMLYLQEPWSDEEEGDDLQEVAAMLVEGDILQEGDAEKGGNLPERADALLERGERVKDEGPPLFQVLGEELWEGEPVVVQPRVHQPAVQQRPGMWDYLFTS